MNTTAEKRKEIAVIGATGQQGGSVVRALQARGKFNVRALSRDPGKHPELPNGVEANLNRPETLEAAFQGVHGVFLVTNFWEPGTDESKQAATAIDAAKKAGVKHFVWSTLPNAEAISGGRYNVPHFTTKAKIDSLVKEAGFPHHTFVIPPFYYQNLVGLMGPQKQADGSFGWTMPLDPEVRCIHMGDVSDLGDIVAGAFENPDEAGNGQYLPLVGDLMSFNGIVDTLSQQGHKFTFTRVPTEVYGTFFPGATEMAEMLAYFQAHTYLGASSTDQIALANRIAGRQPTIWSAWARQHFSVQAH